MNKDQSAFSVLETDTGIKLHAGLTKREYFAGVALQGLLAANATYQGRTDNKDMLAKDAIQTADALLKGLGE